MKHASVPLTWRAERLLSRLLVERAWIPHAGGATILVYHNVSPCADTALLMDDSVSVQAFEAQMLALREHGYKVIALEELVLCLNSGRNPSSKTVAITFDDGYKSVFLYALPILKALGMPATVFLAADYIGNKGEFPWLDAAADHMQTEDLRPLSWDEVSALYRAGIEIGSHSFSHRFMPLLRQEEIRNEILASQAVISEKTGAVPRSFALPFSFPMRHRLWPFFARQLRAALKEGDYHSCCTMIRGHVTGSEDPFSLRRMAIVKYDDLVSFQSKVAGRYAWTRCLQAAHQHTFKKYHVHPR